MIETTVKKMLTIIDSLKKAILDDIEDIKAANHEKLLERNDKKQSLMDEIAELKSELNQYLLQAMKNGEDVNIYRQTVDNLENELKELYDLNGKLASIVLPIRKMYKEIVDELIEKSGGNIFEIKA